MWVFRSDALFNDVELLRQQTGLPIRLICHQADDLSPSIYYALKRGDAISLSTFVKLLRWLNANGLPLARPDHYFQER